MKNKKEISDLGKITRWYFSDRIGSFDNLLISYWYRKLKTYFVGKTMLEIGPADGMMTKLLIPDFEQLYVLDAVREFVRKAKLLDKKVVGFVDLVEEFKTDLRFDNIIISHVLEHVEDPVLVLKKCSDWLNPQGRIHIVVPNANSFHRQIGVQMGLLEKSTDLNDLDKKIGHRRVYDRSSLDRDIRTAKLQTLAQGSMFIKFLSNSQMQGLQDPQLFEAFYQLSHQFPLNGSDLFSVVSKYED